MCSNTYLLAQFPLQIVVFPGENIPLHIFEPRYRQLIADCEASQIQFGITPVIEGRVMEVGTAMQLLSVQKRFPDGRMDIQVEALGCYEIEDFNSAPSNTLYDIALVRDLTLVGEPDLTFSMQLKSLMEELYTIMRISPKKIPARPEVPDLVHKIGFSLQEEYDLLCMTDPMEKQKCIIKRLEQIMPQVRDMEEIRKRIEMNGHPRYILPPNID